MKFIHSFNAFLKNRVNLNQTRVDKANETFDTLKAFLEEAEETSARFVGASRQGSLRQGTIIRPRTDDTEFDVDLLFEMAVVDGWFPSDYLTTVRNAFLASDRYRPMLKSDPIQDRCETIEYVGDFHVDVVPMIQKDGASWIMNRRTEQFEISDGDGYAAWFERQNQRTGGQLVRVVRLLKYLRDEHEWPLKSILLTTMLGLQVHDSDSAAAYPDVPSSLRLLLSRLEAWLDAHPSTPALANPALPAEVFDRHWDAETFETVRQAINRAASLVREAYDATDGDMAAAKWKEVFGDSLPVVEEDLEGAAALAATRFVLGSTDHVRPLSEIAADERLMYTSRVDAWVYDIKGRVRFQGINSGARVASGRALLYKVRTNAPEPFSVYWQVVNTGPHAESEGALRGQFQQGKRLNGERSHKLEDWETSKYTGRHWIECFIVKDGLCVARDRFEINIKNPHF